jgi:hypothetical protein
MGLLKTLLDPLLKARGKTMILIWRPFRRK